MVKKDFLIHLHYRNGCKAAKWYEYRFLLEALHAVWHQIHLLFFFKILRYEKSIDHVGGFDDDGRMLWIRSHGR